MAEIRPATDRDRGAIAALQAASWRNAYAGVLDPDYLASGLAGDLARHWAGQPITPEDVVLVAEDGDVLLGFIAIWCQNTPYIDNLHVDPALRSRGTGRQLMGHAARALRERNHDTAYLWVVSGNSRAISFYLSLGGKISGEGQKDLLGTLTPVTRIEWPTLNRIQNICII